MATIIDNATVKIKPDQLNSLLDIKDVKGSKCHGLKGITPQRRIRQVQKHTLYRFSEIKHREILLGIYWGVRRNSIK